MKSFIVIIWDLGKVDELKDSLKILKSLLMIFSRPYSIKFPLLLLGKCWKLYIFVCVARSCTYLYWKYLYFDRKGFFLLIDFTWYIASNISPTILFTYWADKNSNILQLFSSGNNENNSRITICCQVNYWIVTNTIWIEEFCKNKSPLKSLAKQLFCLILFLYHLPEVDS